MLLGLVQISPVQVEIAQVHVRDGGLNGVFPLGPDLQPAQAARHGSCVRWRS